MNVIFIILLTILILGLTLTIYDIFRPNKVAFYVSTRAHLLRKARIFYLRGKNSIPQWSDEHFQKVIYDFLVEKNIPQKDKNDILRMLSVPEYYRFYFDQTLFGPDVYREMLNDYISGAYKDKIYSMEEKLKECLPKELAKCDNAIKMIIKAQNAGYLNSAAKPTEKYKARPHLSTIAVVGEYICSQNGIGNADKIWGAYWDIKDTTFRKRLSDFDNGKLQSEEILKDIKNNLDLTQPDVK